MKSIKVIALAAVMVGVLAALPAAASASVSAGIVADEYAATLHGSEVESKRLYLAIGLATMECSGLSFEATLKEPALSATTSSVKNPSCGGFASFNMNGCQFELNPGGMGSVRIGPSGCGAVTFSYNSCGKAFSIPANTVIPAEYENLGSGSEAHFTANIDDTGVKYTSPGNLCEKAGTYEDLHVRVGLTVTATNSKAKSIGTKVIGGGLFVGGTSEPKLEAVEYPTEVIGERYEYGPFKGQIKVLDVGAAKVTCSGAQLKGGELSGPATELALTATYSGCLTDYGTAVTVSMNSCHYTLSGFEHYTEEAYLNGSKIACSEGSAIKISGPGCTVSIPAQTLSGESEMINANVANEADLIAIMLGTGVKYTAQNNGCALLIGVTKGTYENGSLESDMLLRGEF